MEYENCIRLNLNDVDIVGESKSCEDELCTVTFLDLKCDRRKRKFRHLAGNNLQTLMSAEFEMQVRPVTPTGQLLSILTSSLQHR